jgi:hypothetical protein
MQKRYLFYTEIYAFFTESPGQSKNRLMIDLGIMENRLFLNKAGNLQPAPKHALFSRIQNRRKVSS